MEMKLHFLVHLCLLAFCLGATTQASCPLLLLLLLCFLSLLSTCTINAWLLPGGFAWRGAHVKDGHIIHGPVGWPLIGSIPTMGPLAHRKLAMISSSLGANHLMALSLGPTRLLISSHPETAREILCGPAFSDRPTKQAARLLMFERAIGFAPSGEYWRHLRRIASVHMFSPRRITGLEAHRLGVAGEMLGRIGREMEERGVVELRGILQKGSLSSMLASVFGNTSVHGLQGDTEMGLMVKEGYYLIGSFNWCDYFPFGFLDLHGVRGRCNKLAERVKSKVGKIIEERRRNGVLMGDDFLSVLLSLPPEERLADSDVTAILWEMIFRGTDTVAILMEWTMARMVLHPDIQSKAQLEIHNLVGNSKPVQDSDIPNLPYIQAIIKEVLRVHPPGPLLSWARLAIHDVYVDKHYVPAGTTAMVNMWAITHDGSIWTDPHKFRPERFMEEEVSVMGSDLRLAPFGSGRRVCPGKALGLATVHLWLARFLQHYTWVPTKSPVDLSEHLRLSLELKKALRCRVQLCN